ncbi:aldehyde dehydrogenase family protein [Bacillus tuaregi]|uniref:aldehyde dehydrogenase family protein n=1 Tax=Bacillus tuaregi TaxID=1816695 RepID=UPI0009FBDAC0|nr:aldehyde dehydrogenase family protein [Bacillus tuaregi]
MIKAAVEKIDNFFGHQEVKSTEYFDVYDPGMFTDVVAKVAKGNSETADQAVQTAYQAYREWKEVPLTERIELVKKAAVVLEESTETLRPLLIRENGGTVKESTADFMRGASIIHNMAERAEAFLEPTQFENKVSWMSIEKTPIGVIGLIVPWNSPIILTMAKLAPALLAGNTVVVKPSRDAPVALTLALKAMAKILPHGVINVVNGRSDVTITLTEHPLVRKISFTGGTETGSSIMASAASTIKKVSLELGGNDPAIILDDADVNKIMPRLCKGIFTRAGQICFAVKRVYVPSHMMNSVYEAMSELVNEYQVGHGLDERTTFGPLINQKQFDYVQGLANKARQSGATVRQVGKKVDQEQWVNGYYMLPSIVRDIDPRHELVVSEQFGPVIPLISYNSIEEAIEMANGTEFGLCSSVWSEDTNHALAVARQLEAGGTFINSHNVDSLSLDMPFGGVKQSGLGRERTEIGFSDYVEYQAIRMLKEN